MMKLMGFVLLVISVFACRKDEIKPVEIATVDCGCEYAHFKEGIPDDVRNRTLQPEFFSMDHLASVFVHYLNTSNREGLESLLITKEEFINWIFPEYNIANPNCNISAEMIYLSVANKSIEGLNLLQSEFFNKNYEFEKLVITNKRQEEEFESYSFFNRTLIYLTRPEGPKILGITGTMVMLNNRVKFLSYRENNHLSN